MRCELRLATILVIFIYTLFLVLADTVYVFVVLISSLATEKLCTVWTWLIEAPAVHALQLL